jgi:hypothetical protein
MVLAESFQNISLGSCGSVLQFLDKVLFASFGHRARFFMQKGNQKGDYGWAKKTTY